MNPTLHIYLKELREMFRDKRVRSGALFWPIAMIVMFLMLFGFLASTLSKPENLKVHVVKGEGALAEAFKKAKLNVQTVDSMAAGEQLIRDGKARVVMALPNDSELGNAGTQPVKVVVAFDPKDQKSQITLAAVRKVFGEMNQEVVKQVLVSRGVSSEMSEPVRVEEKPVKVGEGGANDFVVGMLPYLIVIWAFYGGMSIVSDLVAGEKERATLETLLISPVSRTSIALGKFLALATVCLISSLSSIVGLLVVDVLNLPITRPILEDGMGLNAVSFAVILAVLLPTVALFAALLVAISTYARNIREAQTQTTLLSFVVILPAVFSQFIGFTDFGSERWVSLVPVLNAATTIRNAVLGKFDGVGLLLTLGSSAVLAALAIAFAVRMFQREEVLVRV